MNARLDHFTGLLLGSTNMASLVFNFCNAAQFYDATVLLDV